MDAKAYLISQGWSGPGNPLNPSRRYGGSHAGLGLTKPILVARKKNTHGVGKKTTHDHTNQWWLRGFEEALKGVGDDGGSTPTTNTSDEMRTGMSSALYKFFVRGEGLKGTIGVRIDSTEVVIGNGAIGTTKRKRENQLQLADSRVSDVPKKTKRRKVEKSQPVESELPNHESGQESSDKEKKRRKFKKSKEETDAAARQSRKSEKKKEKKRRKEDSSSNPLSEMGSPTIEHGLSEIISDESARKDRRALKKARKEAKKSKAGCVESKTRKKRRKKSID